MEPARLRRYATTARQPSPFDLRLGAPLAWPEPKRLSDAKAGGANRDRTGDLLHAMQALSQLSYSPEPCRTPDWYLPAQAA